MSWGIVWTVQGIGFVLSAGIMVTRVDAATLGPFASRFVAGGLAMLGYLGLASVSDYAPQLTLNPVKIEVLKYATPIAGVVVLLYYAWKVRENWRDEVASVMRSGPQFVLIVAFAALGRFFLSL